MPITKDGSCMNLFHDFILVICTSSSNREYAQLHPHEYLQVGKLVVSRSKTPCNEHERVI
jgi:hypothetical protein